MTILIADDDAATRRLLLRLVSRLGFDCAAADSAASFRRACADSPPDAVLSDVDLGDGSGVDACLELLAARPDLPVAIMTGDPERAHLARAAGFRCVLQKPFGAADLAAALKELMPPRPPSPGASS